MTEIASGGSAPLQQRTACPYPPGQPQKSFLPCTSPCKTPQETGTLCLVQQKQPSGLCAALLRFLVMLYGFILLLKQALSPKRVWIIFEGFLFFFFFSTGCPAAPIKKPLIPQPFLTARLKSLLNLSKSQATHI